MRQIIQTILLLALLAGSALAQSDYWYYNFDTSHVNFDVYPNLVAVRIDPNNPGYDAQSFAIAHGSLIDTFSFEVYAGRFTIFGIEPGYTLADVMTGLRQEGEVFMVNPVARNYLDERGKLGNRLLVIYKQTTTAAQIDSLQQAWQLTQSEALDDSTLQIYFLDCESRTNLDITALARNYYNTGFCYVVEPNLTTVAHLASADPYYGEQWQLKNTGQHGGTAGVDIDWELSNQWSNPTYSPPVVALLDAGFQMNHEDLPPNWSVYPYNAVDDIEEAWNMCTGTSPLCWHGTAVLGILEANTDNNIGLAGTESRAQVMPIRIVDSWGDVSLESMVRALNWASVRHYSTKAQIVCITISFASGYAATIETMLHQLYSAGVPVIAATGNYGQVDYPASSPYVLAVGMTDNRDDLVSGSGAGAALDLVAPGKTMWTLDLMGNDGLNPAVPGYSCNTDKNYVCNMQGTSFSAPLVPSVAAKLLIRNPWLLGDMHHHDSAEVMYDYLRKSCERQHYGVPDNDERRVNDQVGWGRVNANRAIVAICTSCGDADGSGTINMSDVVFLIGYVFNGTPIPGDCRYWLGLGDADGNGTVNISDAVSLIGFVFNGTPVPHCNGVPSLMATPSIKPPDKELSGF